MASTQQQLNAAAAAWNQFIPNLVDDPNTGHVLTAVQNLPELNPWLSDYAREFRIGENRNPPIPLAEVNTYSHMFSPFIWRVIKQYKLTLPQSQQQRIPLIPDEWLSYGHIANVANRFIETSDFRNSGQTNNPEFFGIGNEAQQKYWARVVSSAVENPTFIDVLFRNLRIPVQIQQQRAIRAVAQNNNLQSALEASRQQYLQEQRRQQYLQEQRRQQNLQNMNENTAFALALQMSLEEEKKKKEAGQQTSLGGKRNKRRQTKRKSRKQKRKSTYRRRR